MNNSIVKPDYIFMWRNLGTLWYGIIVYMLLSSSDLSLILKILLGFFAFTMLQTFIKGYNFIAITKFVPLLPDDSPKKAFFIRLHQQVFVQFVWATVFFVSQIFWLVVIFILKAWL